MAIPESQLSRWSDHVSQEASIRTHESIRRVLANHQWPRGMTYDFYFQGSYRNDTNIRGDSDVDVVLELNSIFNYDATALVEYDRNRLSASFDAPTYTWNDFRRKVTAKLNSETFQSSLLGVAFTCPAYANRKNFEINERLTEKHQSAGLLHLMDARRRGASTADIWAMIKDDPEQVEAYVKILEWAYDEYSSMIKKPGSLFGCD